MYIFIVKSMVYITRLTPTSNAGYSHNVFGRGNASSVFDTPGLVTTVVAFEDDEENRRKKMKYVQWRRMKLPVQIIRFTHPHPPVYYPARQHAIRGHNDPLNVRKDPRLDGG
jgi:hypothetical protein